MDLRSAAFFILRGGMTKQEPHPTLSKGEGFKMFFLKSFKAQVAARLARPSYLRQRKSFLVICLFITTVHQSRKVR